MAGTEKAALRSLSVIKVKPGGFHRSADLWQLHRGREVFLH